MDRGPYAQTLCPKYSHLPGLDWNHLIGKFGDLIERMTVLRQEREREMFVQNRKKALLPIFEALKKERAIPQRWVHWPSLDVVATWDNIKPVLEDEVDEKGWMDVLDGIAPQVEDWLGKKKTRLLELFSETLARSTSPAIRKFYVQHSPIQEQHLELAIAVFAFKGKEVANDPKAKGKYIAGWDTVAAYGTATEHEISCDPQGIDAAWVVASLAGLDPRTTKARDMDLSSLRLACAPCDYGALSIYRWREAVSWLCPLLLIEGAY